MHTELSYQDYQQGDGKNRALVITDAVIINCPAAEEPPISDTMRLGTIAKDLVRRFRNQGVIRRSRNPYIFQMSKGYPLTDIPTFTHLEYDLYLHIKDIKKK